MPALRSLTNTNTMSFIIQEASRSGAKIVIGLAGISGGGKTYTALLLAYGLAQKNASKVGLLCTENGRGRLNADILPNAEKFKIADFVPPFSPDRYIQGIHKFEKEGTEVLIIDSVSHEWEGIGGCEEIATAGDPKVPRWNKAKLEHKRFVNALLQSSMHIIVCIRAREKVKVKNIQGKTVFTPLGLQPITEKNFLFEMTASVMMRDNGRKQDVIKCPEALAKTMGRGNDCLTIQDGQAIRQWIDGGTPVNRDLSHDRANLATACEGGIDALQEAWKALTKESRTELTSELDKFKDSARAYDAQRQIEKQGGDQ